MKKLIYVSAAAGILAFGGIVLADTDDTGAKLETQNVQGEKLFEDSDDRSDVQSADGAATAEASANEQAGTNVQAFIGKQQAIEAAQNAAPGKVEEVERENDDGWMYYEVELEDGKTDYDIIVDAADGTVVSVEADDDNDDDDDRYDNDDDEDEDEDEDEDDDDD